MGQVTLVEERLTVAIVTLVFMKGVALRIFMDPSIPMNNNYHKHTEHVYISM